VAGSAPRPGRRAALQPAVRRREQDGTAGTLLPALGWALEAAVGGVLLVATGRGVGPGWRPLPLLGGALIGGLLVWQAVRGLT